MPDRLRRVIYLLLFTLACSLGDGPFVDEVLTDEQQSQQQQAVQPGQPDGSQPAALVLVYATLMNAPGIVEPPPVVRGMSSQPAPGYRPRRYAPPALSPPHKPPRSPA